MLYTLTSFSLSYLLNSSKFTSYSFSCRYKKKLIGEVCPSSTPIVARDKKDILSLLRNLFKKMFQTQDSIVFNIGIDGVKVPKILQFSTKHQAMIGGCHPQNFITRSEIEEKSGTVEDVQITLKLPGGVVVKKASELKVAVMQFQHCPHSMSPIFPLVAQAQSINQSTGFSSNTCSIVSEAVTELRQEWPNKTIHFLNVCNDAVSCDLHFTITSIASYLDGESEHLGGTDANHNAKSMRGQALVGGTQICVLGTHYIDAGLIKVAGLPVDLWRIRDYASDALVLKLCSHTTVFKITEGLHAERTNRSATTENHSALVYALLFNRSFLYAVNRKGPLSARGRIWMIWSATIFFLHIKGVSIVTKRNFLMGALPLCFLAMDNLVALLHRTTDEVCEHLFGTWRGHSDGFTTREACDLADKSIVYSQLMCKHKFDRGNAKYGYQDDSMQDAECDNDEPKKMSGDSDFFSDNIQVDLGDPGIWKAKGVEMDSNHRASLIWAYLRPEINEINVAMQKFLAHFQVTSFLDLASTEMPVKVHSLKILFFDYVKTGSHDPINKDYQSATNNPAECDNHEEGDDDMDNMDDNMPSNDSKESSIDGVLNRSIDALSELAGFKSPGATTNNQSSNVDDACDDDNTIAHKKTKFQKLREQKETERDVFKNFWTAIDGFSSNKPFSLWHNKFVLKAIESFDLKQRQNGRVDTLGKKMSINTIYS
jgi:hypothetical protein